MDEEDEEDPLGVRRIFEYKSVTETDVPSWTRKYPAAPYAC